MTDVTPPNQIDRAKLDAIVAPIVQSHGGEVVDVEWKPESGGWVLRIYVEKLGAVAKSLSTKDAAVTLELCANIARELSPALDAIEDTFPHAYNLEVSSPGVERPLKSRQDFARFAGEKAKLWLTKAVLPRGLDTGNGQRVLEGHLEKPSTADVIVLRDKNRVFDVPFADIDRARLVFELETEKAASKSGKSHKPITKTGTRGDKSHDKHVKIKGEHHKT